MVWEFCRLLFISIEDILPIVYRSVVTINLQCCYLGAFGIGMDRPMIAE